MVVTIHAAKTNLSKLIEAALAGEEVVIARGQDPVVRIVPIACSKFKIGTLLPELAGTGPDFLDPLSEDELALWEGSE